MSGDKDVKTSDSSSIATAVASAAPFPSQLPKSLLAELEKLLEKLNALPEKKDSLNTFKENIAKIKISVNETNFRIIYKDCINKLRADLLKLLNDQPLMKAADIQQAIYNALIQIALYLPANNTFTVDAKDEIETFEDAISFVELKKDAKTIIFSTGHYVHLDNIIQLHQSKGHFNSALTPAAMETFRESTAAERATHHISEDRAYQTIADTKEQPLTHPALSGNVPCHPLDALNIISVSARTVSGKNNLTTIDRLANEMNFPENSGFSLLHACAMFNKQANYFLLTDPCGPYQFRTLPYNPEDSFGATAGYYGLREGHPKYLAHSGISYPNRFTNYNSHGELMIHTAARLGDVRMLELIKSQDTIDRTGPLYQSPLEQKTKDQKYYPVHLAAMHDRGNFIQKLNELAADILIEAANGETALDIAIKSTNLNAARAFASDNTFFGDKRINLSKKVYVLLAMPANKLTPELKSTLLKEEIIVRFNFILTIALSDTTNINKKDAEQVRQVNTIKKAIQDTFDQKTALGMFLNAPLHQAVSEGDTSHILIYTKILHALGLNIHCKNAEGIPPYYLALQENKSVSITTLEKTFTEEKLTWQQSHWPCLQVAIEKNNLPIMTYLLNTAPKALEEPPLHFAARKNFHATIPTLVNQCKQSVDEKNKKGNTALHEAITSSTSESARAAIALLDLKADYHVPNQEGRTPLSLALLHDNQTILQHMAKIDAEKESKDAKPDVTQFILKNMDQLLLMAAQDVDVESGLQLFKKLLNYFSKENKKYFSRAAHYAVYFDRPEMIKELHRRNFNLNTIEKLFDVENNKRVDLSFKSSPIVMAAVRQNKNVLTTLFECKADINAADHNGDTALHHATTLDESKKVLAEIVTRISVIDFLIGHGADIHAKNKLGNTPLHLCMKMQEIRTVLISCGADIHQENDAKKSALELADTKELGEIAQRELSLRVTIFYDTIKRDIKKSITLFKTAGIVPDESLRKMAMTLRDIDMITILRDKHGMKDHPIKRKRIKRAIENNQPEELDFLFARNKKQREADPEVKPIELLTSDFDAGIEKAKRSNRFDLLKVFAKHDKKIFNHLIEKKEWKLLTELLRRSKNNDAQFKEIKDILTPHQKNLFAEFSEKIKTVSASDSKNEKDNKDSKSSSLSISIEAKDDLLDPVLAKRNLLGLVLAENNFLDAALKTIFPAPTTATAVSVTVVGLFSSTKEYTAVVLDEKGITSHIEEIYSLLKANKNESLLGELITQAMQRNFFQMIKTDANYSKLSPDIIKKLRDIHVTCQDDENNAVIVMRKLMEKLAEINHPTSIIPHKK